MDRVGVKICVQITKFAPARGPLVKGSWLGIAETGGFTTAVRFRRRPLVIRNIMLHNPSEPPVGGPPPFNKGGSGAAAPVQHTDCLPMVLRIATVVDVDHWFSTTCAF